MRDPASYIQFGAWIARSRLAADPAGPRGVRRHPRRLTFASPAYYQVGGSVVPQFMAGLPMVLAAGSGSAAYRGRVPMAPVLGRARAC